MRFLSVGLLSAQVAAVSDSVVSLLKKKQQETLVTQFRKKDAFLSLISHITAIASIN